MNSIVVLQLCSLLLDLVFITLIVVKYWNQQSARSWLSGYAVLAIWAAADLLQNIVSTPAISVVFSRITDASGVLSTILILRYILRSIYPEIGKLKKILNFHMVFTVLLAVSAVILPVYTYQSIKVWWGYYPLHSPWFYILNSYVLIHAFIAIGIPIFRYHLLNDKQKKQMQWFIAGFFFPVVGGAISEVIAPAMGIVMPPLTTVFFCITGFCMAYAIMKYDFLTLTPGLVLGEIFNTITDVIIVIDLNGHIVLSNKRVLDITGYTQEELMNQLISDILYIDSSARLPTEYLLYSPINNQRMFIRTKQNMNNFPVLMVSAVIKDHTHVQGAVLYGRDMTQIDTILQELKQKTSDLEKSKIQLEQHVKEIEKINSILTGRELRMIELKKEILQLQNKLSEAHVT